MSADCCSAGLWELILLTKKKKKKGAVKVRLMRVVAPDQNSKVVGA